SVWMALATILTPVFVWGYGNQEYTFSLAAIQYPILAFCIILLTPYCNQLFILAVAHSSFALIGSCLAALASLLILGTFFIMKHCDKGIIEPGIWLSWKYWAAIGSLVFGIGLIKFFPDLVLKDEIHTLFSTPEKYVEAIGQYASTQGLFLIYVSIAGILLGAVIYTMGFQSLAPCGFLMLSGLIAATIVGIYSKSWESNMVGFAFSTSGIIIFTKLIKELTFFAILHKNRIAAKLFVDVLIAMLAAPIARLFVTAVQHFTIIQAIPIHLYAIGFAIGMILCLFALTRIHHYVKAIPHH
ncbi:MAG TPA: hypothetical protein VN457_00080, partial [Chlamydiales bacterium]|nr:hypothetical protein [Chlamydiales bacterium]